MSSGAAMRPNSLAVWVASMLAVPRVVLTEEYGQATVNPMLLAEQDLAAESRGDVAAALLCTATTRLCSMAGCAGLSVSARLRSRRRSNAAWRPRTSRTLSANAYPAMSRWRRAN